jgi:hypothetical protein
MLRHYDHEGKLLGTFLPSDTFGAGLSPTNAALLVTTTDRIGLYSRSRNEWLEISLAGTMVGRWTGIGSLREVLVTGVGVTSQGVFVTAHPVGGGPISLNKLEKATGFWTTVDTSFWGSKFTGRILGTDNDGLVFSRGQELVWARLE